MDSDIIKIFGTIFLMFALICVGVNYLQNMACHATTEGMKVTAEYNFFAGCRVSTPDGRMVPLNVYREFKQQP